MSNCERRCSPVPGGFTLIELLVVISIIAMLASIVLASLNAARSKARDAVRKEEVAQLQRALELYYNDHGQYPLSSGSTLTGLNSSWTDSADSSWTALQATLQPYMSTLPHDPTENVTFSGFGGYNFGYFSQGYGCPQQWYMIVYDLENAGGTDPSMTACNGQLFQYGGAGANTKVKTIGTKAQ